MPSAAVPALAAAFSLGAAGAAAVGLAVLRLCERRKPKSARKQNDSCSTSEELYRMVDPPHPDWKPGQKLPPPFDTSKMIQVDPEATESGDLYAFAISTVVPRPVAFVSSMSVDGDHNLAPYSYFNIMNHKPGIITIGVSRSGARKGAMKDTLQNIQETGEFVVHIISNWYVEAANHCSGEFPRGVDEWKESGLTPVPSERVKPPRCLEAAVAMECKLRDVHEINRSDGTPVAAVVIGEILLYHVAEEVTGRSPHGKLIIEPQKLQPISRMGGIFYARPSEIFPIARPDANGNYPPKQGSGPADGMRR